VQVTSKVIFKAFRLLTRAYYGKPSKGIPLHFGERATCTKQKREGLIDSYYSSNDEKENHKHINFRVKLSS